MYKFQLSQCKFLSVESCVDWMQVDGSISSSDCRIKLQIFPPNIVTKTSILFTSDGKASGRCQAGNTGCCGGSTYGSCKWGSGVRQPELTCCSSLVDWWLSLPLRSAPAALACGWCVCNCDCLEYKDYAY